MGEQRLFAFTETLIFTEDLLDVAGDQTLFAIQNALLANPLLGDLIKGTSGARKGRIGDPQRGSGKSGGFRFIYVFLERCGRFYLLAIYSKKDKSDLTPKQAAALGDLVREIKRAYGEER
ncbi:MAG: addiction module toxin RelE [Pyrinomonadaceae bacterium]